ncbi:hypothetical protein [Dyadobacter sediminis]|uniref:Lipocalin-like domain-containing protein n=1 Tax=Dyadobacter sediminis TaxID=1493691 RepID=A0A5R9K8I1_9BACT|nr:hypothetical protein [Dyadobacter sediminis]TLU90310.1 hypothetical protein FEM55_17230 [Dyadobacter sediminis]
MNRIVLFVLLLFAFTNCKKDERDPISSFANIAGTWRPIEHTSPDSVTVPVTNAESNIVVFRFDGVMLNKNGYLPCCAPTSYTVNGISMQVKPLIPVELDPICALVNCASCPNFRIVKNKPNELTTYCGEYSTRFVRER